MEHAIDATHCKKTRLKAAKCSRLKRQITCPLAFAATAAASPGFSTAASSFPAVLETFPPMLLVQQRNPTDQMIEQRPQASSRNIQAKRGRLLLRPEPRTEPNLNKPQRDERAFAKCGKGAEEKQFLPPKIIPLLSRVWKWRNWPRRK